MAITLLFFQTAFAIQLLLAENEITSYSQHILTLSFVTLILICFFALRWNVADFTFNVGDASSYLSDGIRQNISGVDRGFFPPLASAYSALGYAIFGMDYISWAMVIVCFAIVPLLYFTFLSVNLSRALALFGSFIFVLSPLHIWFSKTTFSEGIWQVVVLCSFLSVTFLNEARTHQYIILCSITILSIISPFGRGTAPFLMTAVIICIFSIHEMSLKERSLISLFICLIFLASFFIALGLRSEYLVGWQYNRIFPDFDKDQIFFTITIGFLCGLIGLFIIARFLEKKSLIILRSTILGILFSGKFALAYLLEKENWANVFYYNEIDYAKVYFSEFGFWVLVIAIFFVLYAGVRKGGVQYFLIIFYLLFSIPLMLQSKSVDWYHELLLYWHRYYFSELFLISFVFVVIGLANLKINIYNFTTVFNKHLAFRVLTNIAIMIAVACSLNYYYFSTVVSNSYLKGSSQLIQWIKDVAGANPVKIFLSERLRYAGYNGPYLLSNLTAFRLNISSNNTSPEVFFQDFDGVVICSKEFRCEDRLDGYRIGEFSKNISWVPHRGTFGGLSQKQMVFDIEAFQTYPKIVVGKKIQLAHRNFEFIKHNRILKSGWYSLEDESVWSKDYSELQIPIPSECQDSACNLSFAVNAFSASQARPVDFSILNVKNSFEIKYKSTGEQIVAVVPIDHSPSNFANIIIKVPMATSPNAMGISSDNRVLGLAIKWFKYDLIE